MEVNTETVSTFAKLMGDYGVSIVISAAVIALFIYLIIKDKRLLNRLISSGMSHPNAKESNERDEIDMEMKNVLKELLKRTFSDRAYVFLYHNGGVSVSGFSFNKMSIISEADGSGIKLTSPENQSVQRGPYSEMIQSLKNDGEYFISDVETIKDKDTVTYGWMCERASRATYLRAIKDHDRQVIGFFGIDYVTVHDMPSEDSIRLAMAEAAVAVASLIMVGKYQKSLNGDEKVIQ